MIRTNETLNEMKEKVEKFMQEQESFQIRLSRLRANNLLDYETVVLFKGYMNGLSSLDELYQRLDFSDWKLKEKISSNCDIDGFIELGDTYSVSLLNFLDRAQTISNFSRAINKKIKNMEKFLK